MVSVITITIQKTNTVHNITFLISVSCCYFQRYYLSSAQFNECSYPNYGMAKSRRNFSEETYAAVSIVVASTLIHRASPH